MRKIGLAAGLVLAAVALCAAEVKFSSLPLAGSISGTERIVAIQGSGCPTGAQPCNNIAVTPAQIAAYAAASPVFATTYQPLDPDLTSLAGATATGSLYYRSAAGTWSPVTLASNLALSSGTLGVQGLGTMSAQNASAIAITGGSAALASLSIASSTPASSSASCAAGSISWDASYLYVCTATNTWKRVSLTTF